MPRKANPLTKKERKALARLAEEKKQDRRLAAADTDVAAALRHSRPGIAGSGGYRLDQLIPKGTFAAGGSGLGGAAGGALGGLIGLPGPGAAIGRALGGRAGSALAKIVVSEIIKSPATHSRTVPAW